MFGKVDISCGFLYERRKIGARLLVASLRTAMTKLTLMVSTSAAARKGGREVQIGVDTSCMNQLHLEDLHRSFRAFPG